MTTMPADQRAYTLRCARMLAETGEDPDAVDALIAKVVGYRPMDGRERLNLTVRGRRIAPEDEDILIRRLKSQLDELRAGGAKTVVDCALIFEWGIENIFDTVVCVTADEELRKKRIMERDGRSPEDIDRLFNAQLPEREKVRRADIVLENNDESDSIGEFGRMLAERFNSSDNTGRTET